MVNSSWRAVRAALGGSVTIARALPSPKVEAIGPFVFMDIVGPMPSPRFDLKAHPHAGIEVITYLIEGANSHRDSLGNIASIVSGGAQWLTAGAGMLHAETIGQTVDGRTTTTFHAIQFWTRLPIRLQDCAPRFRTVEPTDVPEWKQDGVTLRLLSGQTSIFRAVGPIALAQPSLLIDVALAPDSTVHLPVDGSMELGFHVLSGVLDTGIMGERYSQGDCGMFNPTSTIRLHASNKERCRCLIFGGKRAPRPLVYYQSFVFDSLARAEAAQQSFESGAMGRLDGVPF